MLLVARMDPEVASVRRRALAAALDGVILVAGLVGLLLLSRRRLKGWLGGPDARGAASPAPVPGGRRDRAARFAQSRRGRAVLQAGSLALIGVPLRNWRSPGARICGIRAVDSQTGGPVSVRSAVVRDLAGVAFGLLVRRLTTPFQTRSQAARDRLRALNPRLAALSREHADDREAQQRAFTQFYKDNGVHPLASTAWLVPGVMVMPLSALFSRQRQTIAQRLAGTLIIRSR